MGYLGLFRSANRDLANDRALRLAQEVLGLAKQGDRSLQVALPQTVQASHSHTSCRPLKNHNEHNAILVEQVNSPDFTCWGCELLFEDFEKLQAQIRQL